MKPIRVTAAELSRQSGYSPAHITALTKAGYLKRVDGKYDLEKSRAIIREREQTRVSDGGRPVREIERLRAQNIELKNALLKVDLIKANRETSTGGMRPVAELKRVFSLMTLSARLTLKSYGETVATDAFIAGATSILANDEDRWLHDQIRRDVSGWISQSEGHLARAAILFAECLAAIHGRDIPAEDVATINRIIGSAFEKLKDLPPILSKEAYEEKAIREILARGQDNQTKTADNIGTQ